MRCLLLPLVALAACAPRYEDDIQPPRGDPDAALGCTEIGAFQIAAPQPELHYAPSMDVVLDESELQGSVMFTMVDDLGTSYQWTSETFAPYPNDAGNWWSQDRYHYELAPSHRYTLTATVCPDRTQTVEFFTSAN